MAGPLILLKSAGKDNRHLAENLEILRPEKRTLRSVYGRKWVAGSVREAGDLSGREALLVFFDFGSGLLTPARKAVVRDAPLHEGFLRLNLSLGSFVRCGGEISEAGIQRLGEGEFREDDRRPADGKGRHAFVFDCPESWMAPLGTLEECHTLEGWEALLGGLAGPGESPYRPCRFLCFEHDLAGGGFPDGSEERLPSGLSELRLRLRCIALSEDPFPVRVVAYRGGASTWAGTVEARPGEAVEVSVPLGGGSPRSAPAEPLVVEAFPLSEDAFCNRCALEFLPASDPGEEAPAVGAGRVEAVLAHVLPVSASHREVCTQILSGVRDHAAVEPWLVDRLVAWDMHGDALDLIREIPEVCAEAGHGQFAGWLNALRDREHPGRDVLLRRAFERLLRSAASEPLLRAFVTALEALPPAAFWRACPLNRAWGGAGSDPLSVPFIMALVEEDALWARFAAAVEGASPVPATERRHAVEILYLGDRPEAAGRIELDAAAEGADWVDWARFVDGCPWQRLWEALPGLPPEGSAYGALKGRYYRWKGEGPLPDPDFQADLLHRLHRMAEEAAKDEVSVWLSELASLAAGSLDVLLLGWLTARREHLAECPEALADLERASKALEAERIPREIERLRKAMAGRRVLVLGGKGRPQWGDVLEEELGLTMQFKPSEPAQHFAESDIPQGVDFCLVLKWAHHDASRCAVARLGSERVRYLPSCGKRGAFARLREFAEQME